MTRLNITIDIENLIDQITSSDLNTAVKSQLTLILNKVMEAERDDYINAQRYERSSSRMDYRNGYYEREYVTKLGRIRLTVPRTRTGEFSTEIFQKYKRMDQALVLTLIEAYINGVSTRKVSSLVEMLVGESVSKSFVSTIVAQLDPEIDAFRNRSLTHSSFPYLYVDAMYVKVREDHKIVSKAVYVAQAIREDGFRELVGFKVAGQESEDSWASFFADLRARGLSTPQMVISDAHKGLVQAIRKEFTGAKWQRCAVHFLRNITSKMPKKGSAEARQILKNIFQSNSIPLARERKADLIELVGQDPKYTAALNTLDEGFEDAIQYLSEPEKYQKSLKSTNSLERVNKDIRSRERVVSVFPNAASVVRLLGAVMMDVNELFQKPMRRLLREEDE